MGFVLVAFPGSARSETSHAAGVGAAAAVVMGMVCSGFALAAGERDAGDEQEDEYARRGWLVGLGGSYGIELFEDETESDFQDAFGPALTLSVDDSFGINGRAGYRCHRRFSAEAEVEWLDGFESDLSLAGLGKFARGQIEPVVVTANAKGYLLTGRFQPFLLVGAGGATARVKLRDTLGLGLSDSARETDFVVRGGGGIDFYATKRVVLTADADYVRAFGNLEDFYYVSVGVGLQYRF